MKFIIKNYGELDESEKHTLLSFIAGFGNPLAPKSISRMDSLYGGEGFNLGFSFYTGWLHGELMGCLGYVDKEIPVKKEAYVASIYCEKNNDAILEALYHRALTDSSYREGFQVKLGLNEAVRYFENLFTHKGYQLEYELFHMEKDFFENQDPVEPTNRFEMVSVDEENIEDFLRIHNEGFLHAPNGATISMEELRAEFLERVNKPWLLCLFRDAEGYRGIGQLSTQGDHGIIEGLAVLPSSHDKGLGGEALELIFRKMKNEGLIKCELQVMSNNPRAVHLYEKKGFRRMKTLSYWYSKDF